MDGIGARFPDAQIVDTAFDRGDGFINVYWTDDADGELRSFVLDGGVSQGGIGTFWVEIYDGDYMRDDEAPPPWERKFDDITVDLVIAALITTETPEDPHLRR